MGESHSGVGGAELEKLESLRKVRSYLNFPCLCKCGKHNELPI